MTVPQDDRDPAPGAPSAVSARSSRSWARLEDAPARRSFRGEEARDLQVELLAAAAVTSGGRVLLLREAEEPYRGLWVPPQGYPRPGERLEDAAVREVAEEVGLDIQIEDLLGVFEDFLEGADAHRPARRVIVCYLARSIRAASPRPSREALDFAWVDPGSATVRSPAIVRAMLARLGRVSAAHRA